MPIEKLRPSFTFTEDRLRELQAVVPEAFADGKINWDVLREALGEHLESDEQEHFGLSWPGKREARRLAAMPSKGTLIPQPGQVPFYFKFPPAFKIEFPRIIGNYNPDWGIARYREGRIFLELVRETKGSEDLHTLQFPLEARKIHCAEKHFQAIGVDYRVVSDNTMDWWLSKDQAPS